jgi:lipopolysaccharide transport system permease protein
VLAFNPFADLMAVIHGLLQGMPFSAGNIIRPLLLWLLLMGPAWLLFVRAEPHMREAL